MIARDRADADAVDASVVRSWDEVDPEFREQALETAR